MKPSRFISWESSIGARDEGAAAKLASRTIDEVRRRRARPKRAVEYPQRIDACVRLGHPHKEEWGLLRTADQADDSYCDFHAVGRVRGVQRALHQLWETAVLKALLQSTIREGRLTVVTADGRRLEFGTDPAGEAGPNIQLRLARRSTPFRLALNPELYLGEAYMNGELVIERGSIDDLFDLIGRNLDNLPKPPWPIQALQRMRNRAPGRQSRARASRNVAHHYDLSEDLYRLFLDRDMQYSCAYFDDPEANIDEAQEAKVRHIISKLDLRPGQRVLDIGCGWGGLALEIARQVDVRVTGVTLSQEQLAVARQRVEAEGLADRVSFELIDYRDVRGPFDRIVSVGMFEHVGPSHYGAFFSAVRRLLTEDGVALLHSIIGRTDGGGVNSWMEKYIFPGGYAPTLSETSAAVEATGLWITDVEILRRHYAYTLRHWLNRFRCRRAAAQNLYDERFCRMWEFYLAACAMSFWRGDLVVMQMQMSKAVGALPITRDYMHTAEHSLRVQPARRSSVSTISDRRVAARHRGGARRLRQGS